MNNKPERRKNYPMSQEEMYNIRTLKEFIKKERRADERKRLENIKEQKLVWLKVISACGLMIIILLTLATIGYINNG